MLRYSVLNPVSPQGLAISNLFIAIMIISLGIILLIVGVLAYTMTHFRYRPGQGEPPQTFGVVRLEVIWTVIPFVILVGVFAGTVKSMQVSSPPSDNAPDGHHPDLTVVAHQWWWEIRYASGVVTANEVHIPTGKRMLVALQSTDVIHSFWIPQLNGKMDAVPGQTNYIWLEADRPGSYEGACAEFCGVAHAHMRTVVIAQPPAQYAAWVHQQLTPPPPPTGVAAQGAQLYQQFTCQSCHSASIGPDLSHFATRTSIAALTLTNTPAHLAEWLRNPQAVKPGAHMPNFQLTGSEIDVLTAYLESQR